MKDNVEPKDNPEVSVGDPEAQVARQSYIVTAEHGLFKNGKLYEAGETVELDPKTAQNFIDLGEVEPA